MKNFAKIAVVLAMLCPSANSIAEESSNAPNILKVGGGITALAGGVLWFAQKGEADKCKATAASSSFITCTNLSELEAQSNRYLVVTALGVVAVVVGFAIDKDNSSGFWIRPIHNGIAVERGNGLSFSAHTTGELKLQKTWNF